jgi:hypothetical protein
MPIHEPFSPFDGGNGGKPPKPKPRPRKGDLPPEPNRDELIAAQWIKREFPPKDLLLGEIICTTSRLLLYGPTGIGKTLVAMMMAGSMAAAQQFLNWLGQRHARIMYLDGEMPQETYQERTRMVTDRYGEDIQLFGYNWEALGPDGIPPLNTPMGQAWLWREIDAIKPDAIFFDNIMSLLIGSMSEEESWAPMRPLIRDITKRRIAQIWLGHANDSGKSFGTKTREWEMDTVIALSPPETEDDPNDFAFQMQFPKARLRKPGNADQYTPLIVRPGADWQFTLTARTRPKPKDGGAGVGTAEYMASYDRLARGVSPTPGFNDKPVCKVSTDKIRDELKSRGLLEIDGKGQVTGPSRKELFMAKAKLLKNFRLIEREGLVWRPGNAN